MASASFSRSVLTPMLADALANIRKAIKLGVEQYSARRYDWLDPPPAYLGYWVLEGKFEQVAKLADASNGPIALTAQEYSDISYWATRESNPNTE